MEFEQLPLLDGCVMNFYVFVLVIFNAKHNGPRLTLIIVELKLLVSECEFS